MRARATSLFFFVFLAHAYFVGGLGWNQSARVAATLGFVEPGPNRFTLRIDDFTESDERNSEDRRSAEVRRPLLPNKAPGLSLLDSLCGAVRIERFLEPRTGP
jgi:hypothetical protein